MRGGELLRQRREDLGTSRDEHEPKAAPSDRLRERRAETLRRTRDDRVWSVALGERRARDVSRVKGWSLLANRQVTNSGSIHHARFAMMTVPRAGVAYGPSISSNMMMETLANMTPAQKIAGTRIHSLPFTIAHMAAA